jgi:hypothetical protein
VATRNRLSEEKPYILVFPPVLMAEQLTGMVVVSGLAEQVWVRFLLFSAAPDIPFPGLKPISGSNLSSSIKNALTKECFSNENLSSLLCSGYGPTP